MFTFQQLQAFLIVGEGQIITKVTIAFLCGLLISFFYRQTHKGLHYSTNFNTALIALAMITTVVITVIGNNLARAFGLVGALSIIRFRTAIKDMHDIVFIFFSLALGMASGVGLHLSAILGCILIGVVLLTLSRFTLAFPEKREMILQFAFASRGEAEAPYLTILNEHCARHKLVNLETLKNERWDGDGDGHQDGHTQLLGLSFYADLKRNGSIGKLVRDLGQVEGVERINVFFDEEPF
ncbi:MAG TPA: DUF4956 domain-containing protein [Chloroflexi bacterium]|nr:DUF4956 domain-containing protein [Chloroflexota bacterium]